MSSIIELLLVVCLRGVVAIVVLAIYLPIFQVDGHRKPLKAT